MSDIFREIEEDLRRERLIEIWKRYGSHILVGAGAVLIIAAVVVFWLNYQASQRARQSDAFLAALQAADSGDAPETLLQRFRDIADEGGEGYRVLAQLNQASLLAKSGDTDAASRIYDDVASRSANDQLLRDLARIKSAQLLVDKVSPDDLRARLVGVLDPDNPWRLAARDTLAVAHFNAGNLDAARREYELIALDPMTPPNMRVRANQMLAVLGPEPVEEGPDGAAPEPVPDGAEPALEAVTPDAAPATPE